MSTVIVLIHVVVAIALILIVLLQTGRGSDIGASFGGGASQTLFGSTGASSFLSKITTAAAIVFMLTSLSLAYLSGRPPSSSIMSDVAPAPAAQPAQEGQAESPAEPEAAQPAAVPAPTPEPAEE
jgi:preprotein translocase subunit SecG